ncbi:formyl transferase [Halorubrum californiense DSM 19288]|uniref:Formyl transferase n=1 Tax=Halorubrum californiense DSM 19288 TaxID=1227465 RepID=M0E0M2_9EURY|nr:formyltransferase family protein [Halorubrum californiense]ELZ40568.1 formyl transferase [Halorubrum californiense DSM 19288]
MSLDVALLVDNCSLQEWERQAVSALLDSEDLDVSLSLVVVNGNKRDASTSTRALKFLDEFSLWKCSTLLRVIKAQIVTPAWFRIRTDLNDAVNTLETEIVFCDPVPADDFGNELSDDVVNRLSQTDLAVRFGFGILRGDALDAPTYGVFSYHHGDLSEYRGRPAGFYELIHRQTEAGVTVQQLSDELDAGTVAATTQCDISDAGSLQEVHDRQFSASPPLLPEAVRAVVAGGLPPQPEELGDLYTTPTSTDMIKYWKVRLERLL